VGKSLITQDPFSPDRFLVATEDGVVKCFDARANKNIFTIHAHDAACSALSLSSSLPGCLVTGSSDKTVKVWDIKNGTPSCLVSRDVNVVCLC
jgi:periodic tryptophan protein 1